MANKITYNIGFNVDSSGLKQVQAELQKINNLTLNDLQVIKPGADIAELNKIKDAAKDLEQVLSKSYNVKLDSYNIKTFQQELAKTPGLLNRVQTEFNQLGPTGRIQLNNLTKELLTMNTKVRQTSKVLDDLGKTFMNTLRWSVASSILNSITGSIQQAWGYTKRLDSSLNDIRIVTGKSADEMERFAKYANKAAKGLGASTTAYTNASLIYYQQGLGEDDVQARTNVTLKAANVTGQSAAEVSQQLTAVWNGYKVVAEEAEMYVDKLAAVAATTAADLEELSDGMSKVASAANTMGVDIDQLSAQLATIVSVTRQDASLVGTALKTIYARMGDLKVSGVDEFGTSLGDVSGQMRQMGIEVLDQEGNLRDMGAVIEEVAAKWGTWTDAQQQAAAVAIAGKRQYNNLIALFENWDMYESSLSTSQTSEGTLQKQQDTYMDSIEAHLNQLSVASEKLYDALIDNDAVKGFIDLLTGVVDIFGDITEGIGGVIPMFLSLSGVLGKVFNAQLTDGLRKVGSGFATAFGIGAEAYGAKNSNEVAKQKVEEQLNIEIPEKDRTEAQDQMIKIKEGELKVSKYLTEEQKAQYDLALKETNEIGNQIEQLKLKQEAADKVLKKQSDLAKEFGLDPGSAEKPNNDFTTQALAKAEELKIRKTELFNEKNDRNISITNLDPDKEGNFDEDFEQLRTSGKLKNFQNLNKSDIESRARVAKKKDFESKSIMYSSLADLKELEEQTETIIPKSSQAWKIFQEQKDKFYKGELSGSEYVKTMSKALDNAAGEATDLAKTLPSTTQEVNKLNTEAGKAGETLDRVNKNYQKMQEQIQKEVKLNSIVEMTSALTAVVGACFSIVNAFKIWSDETKTTEEKITQTITAIIGIVAAMVPAFTSILKILKIETTKALGWIGLVLAAASVIITLIIAIASAIKPAESELDKANKALEKSQEAADKAKKSVQSLTDAYADLKAEISDFKEARKALDDMRKGTDEWREAVREINLQAMELMQKYPKLAELAEFDSDLGIWEITEDDWSVLLKDFQDSLAKADLQLLMANNKVLSAARNKVLLEMDSKMGTNGKGLSNIWQYAGEGEIRGDQNYIKSTRSDESQMEKGMIRFTINDLENQGYTDTLIDFFKKWGVEVDQDQSTVQDTGSGDLVFTYDNLDPKIMEQLAQDEEYLKLENNIRSWDESFATAIDTMKGIIQPAYAKITELDQQLVENTKQIYNHIADELDINDKETATQILMYTQGMVDDKKRKQTGIEIIDSLQDTKGWSRHYKNVTDPNLSSAEKEANEKYNQVNAVSLYWGNKIYKSNGKSVFVGDTIDNENDYKAVQQWADNLITLAYGENSGWKATGLGSNAFDNQKTNQLLSFEFQLVSPEGRSEPITFAELQARAVNGDLMAQLKEVVGSDEYIKKMQELESQGKSAKGAYFHKTSSGTQFNSKQIMDMWDDATVQDIDQVIKEGADAGGFKQDFTAQLKGALGSTISALNWNIEGLTLDAAKILSSQYGKIKSGLGQDAINALFSPEITQDADMLAKVTELLGQYDITTVSGINGFITAWHEAGYEMDMFGENWQDVLNQIRSGTRQWVQDAQQVVKNLRFINTELAGLENGAIINKEKYNEILQIAPELAKYFVQLSADEFMSTVAGPALAKIAKGQYSNLDEIQGAYKILNSATVVGQDSLTSDQISAMNSLELYDQLKKLVPQGGGQLRQYLEAAGYSSTEVNSISDFLQAWDQGETNKITDDQIEFVKGAIGTLNQIALDREEGLFDSEDASTKFFTQVLTTWEEVKSYLEGQSDENTPELSPDVFNYYGSQFLSALNLPALGRKWEEETQSWADFTAADITALGELAVRYRKMELDQLVELEQTAERAYGLQRQNILNNIVEVKQEEVTTYSDTIAEMQKRNEYLDFFQNGRLNRDDVIETLSEMDPETEEYKRLNSLLETYDAMIAASWELVDAQIEAFEHGQNMVREFREFEKEWTQNINKLKNTNFDGLTTFADSFSRDFKTSFDNLTFSNAQWNSTWTDELNHLNDLQAAATTNAATLANGEKNPFWNETKGELDAAKAQEAINEQLDTMYGQYEDLYDEANELYDSIMSAGEEINALYDEQIDKLSSANDLLASSIDLYKLVGKGMSGSADDMKAYSELISVNAMTSVNYAKAELAAQKKLYTEAVAKNDQEAMMQYAQSQADAAAKYAQTLQDTFNTVAEQFGIQLEAAIDEAIGEGGLQAFSDAWELEKTYDSAYLDDVNAEYAMYEFNRNVQKSIDETDNIVAQNKLIEMRQRQEARLNAIIAERGRLSQHEIDLANAEYELTLKQIALEEAQQTANTMKLTRDAFGNYSYQYVADENKIADAEAEVKAAENEIYNLRKQHEKELIDSFSAYLTDYQTQRAEAVAAGNDALIETLDEKYLGENGLLTNLQKDVISLGDGTGLFIQQLDTINNMNFDTLKQNIDELTESTSDKLESIRTEIATSIQDFTTVATTLTDTVLSVVDLNEKAEDIINTFSSSVTLLSTVVEQLKTAASNLIPNIEDFMSVYAKKVDVHLTTPKTPDTTDTTDTIDITDNSNTLDRFADLDHNGLSNLFAGKTFAPISKLSIDDNLNNNNKVDLPVNDNEVVIINDSIPVQLASIVDNIQNFLEPHLNNILDVMSNTFSMITSINLSTDELVKATSNAANQVTNAIKDKDLSPVIKVESTSGLRSDISTIMWEDKKSF